MVPQELCPHCSRYFPFGRFGEHVVQCPMGKREERSRDIRDIRARVQDEEAEDKGEA